MGEKISCVPSSLTRTVPMTFRRRDEKPYVIAINAVSGGGKTALAKLVQLSLPGSALFCFDDFEGAAPDDFYEWYKRGCHLEEFDCRQMCEAVSHEIQKGNVEFIILDYPFSRDHPQFQIPIDLSVFVDTPLDVAMARRIVRDYRAADGESAIDAVERMRGEMKHYLEKARYPYLDTERHKATTDLVVDGCRRLEELRDEILLRISSKRRTDS